jgi:hypothetical protein
MQEIEDLEKLWHRQVHLRQFHESPTLENGELMLGATTLLAKGGCSSALDTQNEEARLVTLLSVAYGRTVELTALGALRRAAKQAEAGNDALTAMHIALAGFSTLRNPADAARRIFIADGLLAKGVSPRDIFVALEFDPRPLDELEKYNPDEPRVPGGSGRTSGEWAREIEAVETVAEDVVRELPRVLPRVASIAARTAAALAAAGEAAADALPPVAFLTALLIPTPAGGARVRGDVQGRSDLYYLWSGDETELRVLRRADDREVLSATLYPDGTLRQGPKRIGRKRGDEVAIDPFALPPPWPGPGVPDDDRRLCPKESLDRRGRPDEKGGKKDRDFEDYMKLWVNPDNPTPRGMGYAFFNPSTGNFIVFDDCQKRSGYLFDAKGTTYDWLLTNKSKALRNGTLTDLFEAADRQIAASEGRPIFWVFAEEGAAKVAKEAFHEWDPRTEEEPPPKYKQIHFFVLPWWEGMK